MRRFLLALLLLGCASPLFAGDPHSAYFSADTDKLMWFVHASDTHVGVSGSADSANLQWLTGEARNVIDPSFIVVSGDLTDSTNGNLLGYPNGPYQAEWDEYKNILNANGVGANSYFDIPGNHDAYNDQYFSYYLANAVQGRATGRTQVSWTRTGPWGKYHFLGVNSADNTGAPFSLTWPYGDNAGLDGSELAFINEELNAHPDANLTLIFGHHPLIATGNSSDTYLLYGKDQLVSVMNSYGVSLYGYGHTHVSSESLFTQDMTDGVFYFNVSALGKDSPNQYTVMAIDCNGIASVTQTVRVWPVVLITTPVDSRLGGGANPYAYTVPNGNSNPVRALVFDPNTVTQVQFRVNGGAWHPMAGVPGNLRLWQGFWDASPLAEGEYILDVQATTGSGVRTDTVTVDVKPLPVSDSDDDGIADISDNCPAVANANQLDTDGDGMGNACDDDDDNDTVPDGSDNCPLLANPNQADTDHDGIGDACDPCPTDGTNDADNDGVCGNVDNCPAVANADQLDTDGDGMGNACDGNDDNDTVPDGSDNCPLMANPNQVDADHDGIGDACDTCPADGANDADNDGVCGDVDNCPAMANPNQADADLDGSGDACDPCPADGANDADNDGVCGAVDNCPAMANPNQADADHDGAGDVCDPCPADGADDADGDGVCGNVDNCPAMANPNQADADHDGIGDACDSDNPPAALAPPVMTLTTSGLNVLVSWTGVPGATGYTLHYAPSPYAGPGSVLGVDMGAARSFTASLWDGAAYYVAIRAYNDNASSDYSNVELFEINLPPPAKPVLTLSQSGRTLHASWLPVDGADGYTLFYAPYPYAGEGTIHSIQMQAATDFTVDLWEGAAFYLAVEAYQGSKRSGYSNIELITIE